MTNSTEYAILEFPSAVKWRSWLEQNHASSQGIWIRYFKKNSHTSSIKYSEALDEALCFGWIDSQAKPYDEESYLQKFTPRRTKSLWSKRNREHIERLITENKMQPAGLHEVEKAKADGRWEQAYDSPSNMQIPQDFLQALQKKRKAYEFFQTLNKTNTYAIAYRLQTAKKAETRQKRMEVILQMMADGKKFH